MMKKFLTAALAATALLGAGCIFSKNVYVEKSEFDLELPKKIQPECQVRIGVFKNISGSDRRFLMRRGDGQLVSLEYQRWRFIPELLLERCMYGAFLVSDNDTVPQVNAVIYRFEFDEKSNSARLSVDFTFSGCASNRKSTVRTDIAVAVKSTGDIAAARAAAMSECARLAIEKLAAEMRK